MDIGDKFDHAHLPTVSCEIIKVTNKGYQVLQTSVINKKQKSIKQYYFAVDFHPHKGFWKPQKK
jgi:hypothetical protein